MMTLNQLKIFVAVAELGNVTKAAEILGITQSAASAAIATLENQYEARLFQRVGRAIELSEIGRLFLPNAQDVIAASATAARSLQRLGGKAKGKIKIIASQTIANYWLPNRLSSFHLNNPDVQLNVAMSNTRGVEAAITSGRAEIGFVEGEIASEYLHVIQADYDYPVLVASIGLSKKFNISGSEIELSKLPWVIRERGSGTREILEDLILRQDINWEDLNIVLELPSNESVKEAVESGAGVTLISRYVVEQSLNAGLLEAFPLEFKKRNFFMVFHKHRPTSNAVEAFLSTITKGPITKQSVNSIE